MRNKRKKTAESKLIENMGLFWKADDVFWGQPKRQGTLLGVQAKNVTGSEINFRDQIGIYVLYSDYKIVYVGQTGKGNQKLLHRLKQHLSDALSGRWDRFSWFGTRRVLGNNSLQTPKEAAHPSTEQILNYMEGILIHTAEPPLNRQGGRLKDVIRYLQVRDERLGPTEVEILKKLHQNNK